jgi:hypothetical protein
MAVSGCKVAARWRCMNFPDSASQPTDFKLIEMQQNLAF